MIRVSTTLKKLREEIEDVAPDGYNTEQQLEAMRQRARQMLQDQATVWDELRQLLAAEQISLLERDEWTPEIREHLTGYFSREICPVLTPLAFDPGPSVPVHLEPEQELRGGRPARRPDQVRPREGARRAAAVRRRFPSRSAAPARSTFVFLEDVIRANIQELFPGTQVKGAHLFRIIRDADLEIEEDEADDLLESIDRSLQAAPPRRHLAAARRSRHADARPQHPRRELRGHRRRGAADAGSSGLRRLVAADAHSPARAEGRAVLAAQPVARRRGSGSDLRPDPLPGRPRPSPVRVVRVGRDVPARGGAGPARHRDQDDAVPHRPELAADSAAHRGGRGRQAGGGAGRAQGAIRRAQQHPLGAGGWSRTASTSSTASPI